MRTAPHGFLRVAACCPPLKVADPDHNLAETLRFVTAARAEGVQALACPELGLTGYTCGDLFFSLRTLVEGTERALGRLREATASHSMVVIVGMRLRNRFRVWTLACAVASPAPPAITTVRSPVPVLKPAVPRYCDSPVMRPTAAAAPNVDQ